MMKKLHSMEYLDKEIKLYKKCTKLKDVCVRFPNFSRCTITEISKTFKEGVTILKPGQNTIITKSLFCEIWFLLNATRFFIPCVVL